MATFDARDMGLRRLHPPRQLRLRQACGGPRLDQRACESELLFEAVVLSLMVVIPAPAAMKVLDLGQAAPQLRVDRLIQRFDGERPPSTSAGR